MRRLWIALFTLSCASSRQFDALQAALVSQGARITALEKALASREQAAARGAAVSEVRALIQAPHGLRATIATSLGDIHCDLFPDDAPLNVANFVQLAEGTRAWVDPRTSQPGVGSPWPGSTFHRVIPGFVIQGGDPLGDGTGRPGYFVEDEFSSHNFAEPGVLAMANAGPGTNGMQFFVTGAPVSWLDGRHTIIGACDLPVVERIMAVKTGPGDKPVEPVELRAVTIEREP
jgi:peptidyl-prolyl cis-trans isomerase A (cyclophilin A)